MISYRFFYCAICRLLSVFFAVTLVHCILSFSFCSFKFGRLGVPVLYAANDDSPQSSSFSEIPFSQTQEFLQLHEKMKIERPEWRPILLAQLLLRLEKDPTPFAQTLRRELMSEAQSYPLWPVALQKAWVQEYINIINSDITFKLSYYDFILRSLKLNPRFFDADILAQLVDSFDQDALKQFELLFYSRFVPERSRRLIQAMEKFYWPEPLNNELDFEDLMHTFLPLALNMLEVETLNPSWRARLRQWFDPFAVQSEPAVKLEYASASAFSSAVTSAFVTSSAPASFTASSLMLPPSQQNLIYRIWMGLVVQPQLVAEIFQFDHEHDDLQLSDHVVEVLSQRKTFDMLLRQRQKWLMDERWYDFRMPIKAMLDHQQWANWSENSRLKVEKELRSVFQKLLLKSVYKVFNRHVSGQTADGRATGLQVTNKTTHGIKQSVVSESLLQAGLQATLQYFPKSAPIFDQLLVWSQNENLFSQPFSHNFEETNVQRRLIWRVLKPHVAMLETIKWIEAFNPFSPQAQDFVRNIVIEMLESPQMLYEAAGELPSFMRALNPFPTAKLLLLKDPVLANWTLRDRWILESIPRLIQVERRKYLLDDEKTWGSVFDKLKIEDKSQVDPSIRPLFLINEGAFFKLLHHLSLLFLSSVQINDVKISLHPTLKNELRGYLKQDQTLDLSFAFLVLSPSTLSEFASDLRPEFRAWLTEDKRRIADLADIRSKWLNSFKRPEEFTAEDLHRLLSFQVKDELVQTIEGLPISMRESLKLVSFGKNRIRGLTVCSDTLVERDQGEDQ